MLSLWTCKSANANVEAISIAPDSDHTLCDASTPERSMMRRFLMVVALLVLSAPPLPAKQAAVTRSAVKPQATAPQWHTLKSRGIKMVRLTPVADGKQVKVHMTGIRAALEKAAVNETVSVLLYVGGKRVATLGRYAPSRKSGKTRFSQMPAVKKIPGNIPRTQPGELVFVNGAGKIVARVPTKLVQNSTVLKNNTAIPR